MAQFADHSGFVEGWRLVHWRSSRRLFFQIARAKRSRPLGRAGRRHPSTEPFQIGRLDLRPRDRPEMLELARPGEAAPNEGVYQADAVQLTRTGLPPTGQIGQIARPKERRAGKEGGST